LSEPAVQHEGISDEQLARDAGAGCPSAFATLIERFEPRVRGFVARYRLGPADTDDVVQETFMHAWAGIDRYDPERRFSTWLLTIAARRAITQIRSSTARRTPAPIADRDVACEDGGVELDAPPSVWEIAARELPAEQHAALWLRYVEGLGAKQIGRILGKSQVAVRVMLFRARERLAKVESIAVLNSEDAEAPADDRTETDPGRRANTLEMRRSRHRMGSPAG
jgi:RNA polymerase sigma-70 factor (ECF subfamily)